MGAYVIRRFDLVIYDHVATYSGTFKRDEVEDMVHEYNQNLEPGEEPMTVVEMIEILQEKGGIHATQPSLW